MAQPKRIDELDAVGTLSAAAAIAIVQAGATYRTTPAAFITEAESFTQSGSGAVAEDVQTALRRIAIFPEQFDDDFAATIAAARYSTTRMRPIWLAPQKTYTISETITLQDIVGLKIIGNGAIFDWAGDSSDPMFLLDDVRESVFEHFYITADATTPLHTAFRIQNGSGSSVAPRYRTFRNVVIDGTTNGVTYGFHWDDSGAGGDNNNDTDILERVQVHNFSDRAFYLEGQQPKDPLFVGCIVATGAYAVYANASFRWIGGLVTGMTSADFYINAPQNEPFHIIGCDSENGVRLLETAGPASTRAPVTLQSCRWVSDNLHADNRAVVHQLAGGLTLIGNNIRTSSGGDALEIYHNPNSGSSGEGFRGPAVAFGNSIGSTLLNPFTGSNWRTHSNTILDGATNRGIAAQQDGAIISFADQDATPTVCNANVYKTANTVATSIATFDDGFDNQEITIIFGDALTTLVNSSTLRLNGPFTSKVNDVMVLRYDGTTWWEVSRNNPADQRNVVRLFDDFLGDVLADEWGSQVGSDPQVVAPAITAIARGSVRLVTGDDAAGTMAVNGVQLDSQLNWQANQGGLVIEIRIALSAITDVAVFIGLTDQIASLEIPIQSAASSDSITTNATDAVGVMFDTAMATDNWWRVGVANNVDASRVNSTLAPSAGTYETWRIEITSAGVATFYRNGTANGSAMTGAVTATVPLTPVVAAFSRGAASRDIDVDYIMVQANR